MARVRAISRSAAAVLDALTTPNGLSWVLAVDTTNKRVRLFDGTTLGGIPLANADDSFTLGSTTITLGSTVTTVAGLTLNSPTLVTPALGTPSSGTLTNCTGLPISTGVSGLGTGVATALAVNIGSAGAPVLFNGALGTPSSGTLTNATGLPVSTGISGLAAGVATFLATPNSANLRAALTDESGTGLAYFQGGDIGTPSAGVLTNATGLPISTGVSGLGAGVATFLATPSSANLATAVTDETGSGALVFGTSPAIASPTFSGTAIGTYTLGGTPTLSGGTLSGTTTLPVSGQLSSAGLLGLGVTPTAWLDVAATLSSAPAATTTGVLARFRGVTHTDTTGSGSIANRVAFSFGAPTFASTNVQTLDAAATVYISGPPAAGTNTTLTSSASLVVASGNVGIGTTTPNFALTIRNSSAANEMLSQSTNGTSLFLRTDGTNSFINNMDNFASNGSSGNGFLILTGQSGIRLNYGSVGSAGTTALALDASGNVGIGTTTPDATLHLGVGKTYRLSNVRTDASNGDWYEQKFSSNIAIVGTNKNGTGVARELDLQTGGVVGLAMHATTQLIAIGPSAAFTSSFPALKRSSTELQHRLGDDTAFAPTAASVLAQAAGENANRLELKSLTELTTIAAAATTDTTIQIPANALVIGVSVRVTTVIPTAATFDYGVAGATTRYGTGISTAANTTSPGTIDAVRYYSAATAIRITPNLTPADNSGRVRVTIHYILITPPTS